MMKLDFIADEDIVFGNEYYLHDQCIDTLIGFESHSAIYNMFNYA